MSKSFSTLKSTRKRVWAGASCRERSASRASSPRRLRQGRATMSAAARFTMPYWSRIGGIAVAARRLLSRQRSVASWWRLTRCLARPTTTSRAASTTRRCVASRDLAFESPACRGLISPRAACSCLSCRRWSARHTCKWRLQSSDPPRSAVPPGARRAPSPRLRPASTTRRSQAC